MTLSWSGRRQLLYYGVGLIVLGILLWGGYQYFFTAQPTCSDGVQNGDEVGVDCGGSCALLCRNDAKAPVVLWSRAFQVGTSTYTAAAYVQNNNAGVGAKNVAYTFRLYDDQNSLVTEREGIINIPPSVLVPIVETGIGVGERGVARTLFCFNYESMCSVTQTPPPSWQKPATRPPVLRIANQILEPDGSALAATIINDTLNDVQKTTVVAILFDSGGVARAASKSVVSVAAQSSQRVIFTWPNPIPDIIRAEITVLSPF
jgi:hypothetical protein